MNPQNKIVLALDSLTIDQPLLGAILSRFTIVKGEEGDYSFLLDPQRARITYSATWIDQQDSGGLVFSLGVVALSLAFNHVERCGGRDANLWAKACLHTNAHFLVTHRIGRLPQGALYEPAYAGKTTEEVYDILSTAARPQSKSQIMADHAGDRIAIIDQRLSQMSPADLRGLPVLLDKVDGAVTAALAGTTGTGKTTSAASILKHFQHVELDPITQQKRLVDVFDKKATQASNVIHRNYYEGLARIAREKLASMTPKIDQAGTVRSYLGKYEPNSTFITTEE